MKRLLSLLALTSFAAAAQAQVIGQNKSADQAQTYTLNVKSQLVIETVVVKDKAGKPITGLGPKDFTVTEDGQPQTVRFAEYQSLPTTVEPMPQQKPSDEDIKIYKRLAQTQITPEPQGSGKYRDKRLIAMYFDMTAMRPDDQMRSLSAAEKFIRTQMTTSDEVAIMRYQGGAVDVLQDFSHDRNRLLSILETLVVGEGQGDVEMPGDSSASDTGAAFGQDDSEFNIFNTDRQLSALQTAARMLGALSEKKVLIYFASGLRLNGVNNQAQLHATVDAAIRSGVAFWPIDARGLVAGAPLGDASQGSQGSAAMYNGQAALAQQTSFQQSQDTLYALAGDTGGKALLDYNDLGKGIVEAQKSVSSYYVVGYYTSNTNLDGKFRKVNITVGVENASLDYRKGYYAGKEFKKFTDVDRERQLEDALMLPDPITELTIAVEINYFQLNRAEYYVPVVIKIPGRELALAKKGGAEHTLIDFVGEIKDANGGNTVQNVRDNVNIKLSDSTAQQLASRPVQYDSGYTLLPGKYTIKLLARDDETGRIGTYQTTFTIPNLNKEYKKVATSSVVLASQRVDVNDGLYNAMKGKDLNKQNAVNPLIFDGKKLIPSVTRVFSRTRDLHIFLQAYTMDGQNPPSTTPATPAPAAAATPAPAAAAAPLVAYVSFYDQKNKLMETQPVSVQPVAGSRLGLTPFRFDVSLASLPPGEYNCQVTVLDPSGSKAAFWQAPIMVVQ